MAYPAPPLPSTPPPPPPWQLSSSHLLLIPLTPPFLRLNSRSVILHARNVNSDPSRFDDDNVVFLRRRRRRRKPQGGNGRRSRQPRWWSDDHQDDDEEEGGILQQLVDNLWILQVFKSYGLFLPIILISLLIATGPKAFIMGSGIPFGLSLLAFAFNKLSQSLNYTLTSKPTPKYMHSRSHFDGKWDISMEDQNTQQQQTRQGEKNKSRNYRTRINSFGGWDELLTEHETERPSGTKQRFEMMTGKKLGSSLEER
ncbi:uncharacterized protein LOC141640010 [Silene latifolia]|uniref:uncharacterized protein LOC141640010 n=1 Tax=Silene latifolia TaxID=37657 RepID=UPI003D7813F2